MKTTDIRKFSQEAQYELRKQVIRLRGKGLNNEAISEIVGLSPSHISTIWQRYQRGGLDAIKPGFRGRRVGSQRKLTSSQEMIFQKLLRAPPDQAGLVFALWSRKAIQLAIHQMFEIDLPLRTTSDYLKRWNLPLQKSSRLNFKENNKVGQKQQEAYQKFLARAKQEKAALHWGKVVCVQAQVFYSVRDYSNRAAPIVQRSATKSQFGMISSVANDKTVRFLLFNTPLTPKVLIDFLQRLCRETSNKVFLVITNVPSYYTNDVKAWLDENEDKIEVFHAFTQMMSLEDIANKVLGPSYQTDQRGKHPTKKTTSFIQGLRQGPKYPRKKMYRRTKSGFGRKQVLRRRMSASIAKPPQQG